MRVAHICPHFFSDGFTYQENLLARQHHADGHEVLVIASAERLDSDGKLVQCETGRSTSVDGFAIHRVGHLPLLPLRVAQKVRWMRGLERVLEEFRPDAAVFHGPQSLSLVTFRNFQRRHPQVHCHVDCHSDPYSTGQTWVSRNLLHRVFYRMLVRAVFPELKPLLCISIDVQRFVVQHYGLAPQELAFYPLGGFPYADEEYQALRARGRVRLAADPETTVILQTGKMDGKKLLVQTLNAFRASALPNAMLVLAGSLSVDTRAVCEPLIAADPRVRFLGWVDARQLSELLCACDLYVQPGSQSATMQLALCCRCPVLLRDVPSHGPFVRENGWLVRSETDIQTAFDQLLDDRSCLAQMSRRSFEIAKELLDYQMLSKRVLAQR